jgi:hypothetical protein
LRDGSGGVTRACEAPLSEDDLLDWWSGGLPGECRRSVEEHLLSCDACATRGHDLAALAQGVRGLVREGRLPAVVLPAVVDRLEREGRRIRTYRVPAGSGVHCTVGPEDDVVLARLEVDLRGVSRLDLVSRIDDGPERRLSDLPFDEAAGELILAAPTPILRERPRHVERLRLLALDPGGERLLGEYTFDHTPWPGSGR